MPPPRSPPLTPLHRLETRDRCSYVARSRHSCRKSTRTPAPHPAGPIVRIRSLLGVSKSPVHLLVHTPANTPQIGAASHAFTMTASCILEEEGLLPKLHFHCSAARLIK
ncbi:hypothetical protein GUJ93_ZPchr0013g36503 [Zizania palustris]|uniref:Uncharacterized protein n=1 Tax=Zizania palustris TaxID=103762 RepID=A0A8J5WW86_ZIZPA|nr:hypothetical protein GUJ93_ZPchr0013g36503 [Zizania palustris]